MHIQYANRKKGIEEAEEQIKGTDFITKNTYNTIIYQEQCMLIAKHVAKFDDSQSDSLCRKPLAKKKADLMEIFRRCFIYGKLNIKDPTPDSQDVNRPYYDPSAKYGGQILGGINNGYSEEELLDFYIKLKGYASYLFNRSHSASYSVVTLCTMLLKHKYRAKFYAALLSMQTDQDKVDLYVKLARKDGIEVLPPDANKSDMFFTESDGKILYGIGSIKGIGAAAIPTIIDNRPYLSVEDAASRATEEYIDEKGKKVKPKKILGKKIMTGLISSGAFDFEDTNRYRLLNESIKIRKDKDELLLEDFYNREHCMKLEKEYLGTNITYLPWFDTLIDGDVFKNVEFKLLGNSTKKDKKGNTMAFARLEKDGVEISALAFASIYGKSVRCFDTRVTEKVLVSGKKDGVKIIISSITTSLVKQDNCSDILSIM